MPSKTAAKTSTKRSRPIEPVKTEIVEVTPDLAEDWLGRNSHNRNLRNRQVEFLAGAILRDEWKLNGDAIRFAADGKLLDGQHRLWAVIEAGKSIKTLVISGLDDSTQETMDTGAKRNLADALKLRGEGNATKLAATINYFWRWQVADTVRNMSSKPSIQQAIATLDEHPGLRDSAKLTNKMGNRFRISSGMLSAAHYVLHSIESEDASVFFDKLESGIGLEEGSPILVLRRYLEQQSVAGAGARTSAVIHHALIIKAWNAWRDGLHVDRLNWKASGMRAEAFPEPY